MKHDHLCPSRTKELIDAQICTFCEIIRATRKEYEHADVAVSPV